MGHYEPQTVCQLADVIDDICRALQDDRGQPVIGPLKLALSKRMLELFENGIIDPDRLRLEVMADSLWASSAHGIPLPKRAYKLAWSGVCKSVSEIGRRLKLEGYSTASVDAQLGENALSADLARILSRADNT